MGKLLPMPNSQLPPKNHDRQAKSLPLNEGPLLYTWGHGLGRMTAIVEDLLMLMISFVLANLRALMLERRGAMGTKRADKPEKSRVR